MGSDRRTQALSLVIGIAAALLLAEVGLRVYQRVVAGVPLLAFLPAYHERTFPLSPFLVFGPRTRWQIPNKTHPETAYFNDQGFRTHEHLGPKPPGELRLIALGGSTTEDVWNDAGIHWPLIAERTLHAAGRPDVRIYNGAMSAYTTAHSLVRLSLDVLEYQPDVVLVMHNINDLLVAYSAGAQGRRVDGNYLVKYGSKSLTSVLDESDVVLSRLWVFLRERLRRLWPEPPSPPLESYDLESARKIFERNLRSIVAVARSHGSAVVFVTMPLARSPLRFHETTTLARGGIVDRMPAHERFLSDFDAYNESVRRVAAELGVPVIDAARLVPSDDRLFADLVHTTSAGVQVMGETVGKRLLEILPPPQEVR